MDDVYDRLRQRLDEQATGFPATARKIEIKILKQLFSEEEAALYLLLTPVPESPSTVAARVEGDSGRIAEQLAEMARRGLVYRLKKSDQPLYAAVPFVPGIFEHQVGRFTQELAMDIKDYYDGEFGRTIMAYRHAPLRTIPIERELVSEYPVTPYEDVVHIMESRKKIVVLNCVCREWGRLVGNTCGKPLETCFYFGSYGDYFLNNGTGRVVDAAEALGIIRKNLDDTGLVLQVGGGQKPTVLCMCCGDCCNMLLSLKLQPNPARASTSNYLAVVDPDACTGCESCLDRCQMEAIEIGDSQAAINLERCIGCGTCIFDCDADALQLTRKPASDIYTPPANSVEIYLDIAAERGKL